ncbi:NAD(P)/FAD-dependent oxidoreductase [Coraliomargarita sp. SDUM461004]|uniref:NADH:ubiquinone reductase (non-electrogenic) n=1 Tax=Thalassobacterium sedimentorum TaxID=3041258 RepID=A0ABU1AKD0_9BACT|nr:NAD(P)/FAD-dependent oxidoreductase [Coraliomargarita sp. SDUM461004]MDQ8195238.1 NAD(P)/FAD-dependent oxidoreductase [Coraliomargarita sp. SDUM461004]
MPKKKHIVVLGAGFGGLTFTQKFRHPNARITIVDRQNHHLFQPLLYQVATGGLAMPEIAEPVRTILAKRNDVQVLMDSARTIDVQQKKVELTHQTLHYDYLVVALGMVNSYFGNNEWARHTIGLKSLNDARRIRQRVLHAFERAEALQDEAERQRLMTVVVVGAGPTGVEMAGALSELTKRVFKKDFRSIRPEQSRIILVEAADRVLTMYSKSSSAKAQASLKRMGVELKLNHPVENISQGCITVGSETIEAESIIWTAGVEANPLVKHLPGDHNRKGQVAIDPDCSIPEHPEVFAIGDIVDLTDAKGVHVPGVSPAAMQMGKHVARIIHDELEGQSSSRPAFTYLDKGSMATIGRSSAVAEFGKFKFSGFPAWFLWLAVHLVFLIGFRNRLTVLIQWMYAYLKYRPGARVFEKPDSPNQPVI